VTIGFVNVCSKGGHETHSHRIILFALGCLFNASVVYRWLIFVLTSVLLIITKEVLSFFLFKYVQLVFSVCGFQGVTLPWHHIISYRRGRCLPRYKNKNIANQQHQSTATSKRYVFQSLFSLGPKIKVVLTKPTTVDETNKVLNLITEKSPNCVWQQTKQ
jgi:hypothetical protein